MVRIDDDTKHRVDTLAGETGQSRQRVVAEALDSYERERFWRAFGAGYTRIAADPAAQRAVEAERTGEAGALRDGLDG